MKRNAVYFTLPFVGFWLVFFSRTASFQFPALYIMGLILLFVWVILEEPKGGDK